MTWCTVWKGTPHVTRVHNIYIIGTDLFVRMQYCCVRVHVKNIFSHVQKGLVSVQSFVHIQIILYVKKNV